MRKLQIIHIMVPSGHILCLGREVCSPGGVLWVWM